MIPLLGHYNAWKVHGVRQLKIKGKTVIQELEVIKQQLIDLQSQLAFQEDTVQSLNDVVTRQQQQIENLHELCSSQKLQLDEINSDMGKNDLDERPPHY